MVKLLDFPNYYVTEDGLIWSERSKKFIKPEANSTGHLRVELSGRTTKQGRVRKFIHHLVAAAYLPAPVGENLILDHLDNDQSNNHFGNLCWMSKLDNDVKDKAKRWHFLLNNTPIVVFNLKEYCRDMNLNYSCMRKVAKGKQSAHRGYSVV